MIIIKSINYYFHLKLWIIILTVLGYPDINNGLSPLNKNNMLIGNKRIMYLLAPHTEIETSESPIELYKQLTLNNQADYHNFHLKETNLISNNNNNKETNNNYLTITNGEDNLLEEIYRKPMFFGTENSTIVNTQLGATAHIPCVIHHIGDGVMSWIRRRDYHLLTVGLTTYSSDQRYSATHLKHSEDWTLQIKFVQSSDEGLYECQVSTHPPTSIFLYLNVTEALSEIVGPSIKYLTPGSTLKLICRLIQSTEQSAYIFWYHDNRMINYDTDRGINVSTDSDYHYSELTIIQANKKHSGNYTCVPSNAQPTSVLVHIFKGDNPAAMHHEHRNTSNKIQLLLSSYRLLLIIVLLIIYLNLSN